MMRYEHALGSLNWVTDKLYMINSEDPDSLDNDVDFLEKIKQGKFISKD